MTGVLPVPPDGALLMLVSFSVDDASWESSVSFSCKKWPTFVLVGTHSGSKFKLFPFDFRLNVGVVVH